MNSGVGLGRADADATWAALQRHQVAALLLASGGVVTWLFSSWVPLWSLVIPALALVSALPASEGVTVATSVALLLRFWTRSAWHRFDVGAMNRECGTRMLEHVGRLDLSGQDLHLISQLREVAASMAARPDGGHITLQVVRVDDHPVMLMTGTDFDHPMWRRAHVGTPFGTTTGTRMVRERWRSLTSIDGSVAVLRLHAFAPNQQGPALAALQVLSVPSLLTLQCGVVAATRAHGVVGRAVHRSGSDSVAVHALGFRRSARRTVELERLAQREQLVATGRSLLQLGVYVTVLGANERELRARVKSVLSEARRAGLVLHRGYGRQAQWFRWTLPRGVVT